MQRVRIGLTGLAFVFLAVLLAAVFTGRASDEAPITPNLIEQQEKGAARAAPVVEPQSAEPLATMKLTPGDADVNVSTQAPAAPAPAPAN